ncbi:DoxX family protein [Dyadobacter luticola]|uniref:DoxX family protein n=1 Tax=Dyadobacter luticola TaxID=1979387 RepID=A0A5R9KRS2_9BACT|nr:DoxX family protein [Dyadobacter luticola]TLU98920.1 DoxX family protein [Dyadobacter luticola]
MKKFLKPLKLPSLADFAVLILRLGMAALMIRFGYDKLTNFISGDRDFPDPIGLGPTLSYILTIFAEFVCSILIALGLFSRPALLVLIINMLVIVLVVHGNDPFDKKEHGISFLISYVALFLTGPGRFSVDRYLYK